MTFLSEKEINALDNQILQHSQEPRRMATPAGQAPESVLLDEEFLRSDDPQSAPQDDPTRISLEDYERAANEDPPPSQHTTENQGNGFQYKAQARLIVISVDALISQACGAYCNHPAQEFKADPQQREELIEATHSYLQTVQGNISPAWSLAMVAVATFGGPILKARMLKGAQADEPEQNAAA